jgi:prepilin-type N-terminal cleavage/methylation domain-containing protein
MRFNITSHKSAGFSLVELSVVLVIVGTLLGMVITGIVSFAKNAANSATRSKQVAIQEALLSYLRANGRLPCPDTGQPSSLGISTANLPDGVENRATEGDPTTGCRSPAGLVPYATLGMPRDAAIDPWGNFISYIVSNNNAPAAPLAATPTRDWAVKANFKSGSMGDIEVLDDLNTAAPAVAVLISHGIGGDGAFTTKGTQIAVPSGAHELINASGCQREGASGLLRCYKREFTENTLVAGGAFDDVVLLLTATMLLDPLFSQGIRFPPATEFAKQCDEIKGQLVASGYTNRTGSPGTYSYNLTPVAAKTFTMSNPYGADLSCTIPLGASIVLSSTGPLCTFTSLGIDLAQATDDLVCTIKKDDLVAVYSKTGF